MATKFINKTAKGITKYTKNTGALSARQQLKSQKIAAKKARTSESFKTQRAAQRAAAVTSISNTAIRNDAQTRQKQSENQKVLSQYLALINGNQAGINAANPDDTSGQSSNTTTGLDQLQFGGVR